MVLLWLSYSFRDFRLDGICHRKPVDRLRELDLSDNHLGPKAVAKARWAIYLVLNYVYIWKLTHVLLYLYIYIFCMYMYILYVNIYIYMCT